MDKKVIGISFDGGSIRGYFTTCLLTEVSKQHPKFLKKVSIFSGTSTGSFIACMLATGMSPQEVKDFYIKYSPRVFSDTWWHNVRGFGTTFRAKYRVEPLRDALTQAFGLKRIGDLEKQVLIPAYNIDDHKAKYFDYQDKHITLVEACLASSAIPIYFPVHRFYRGPHWIDGGVAANNPTMSLLAQMLNGKTLNNLQDINILSLGTGLTEKRGKKISEKDLGGYQWLKRAPELLRILLEAPDESVNYQAKQILGDRYFRLNPKIPHIGLDDVGAIAQIDELMKTVYVKEHISICVDWISENGS